MGIGELNNFESNNDSEKENRVLNDSTLAKNNDLPAQKSMNKPKVVDIKKVKIEGLSSRNGGNTLKQGISLAGTEHDYSRNPQSTNSQNDTHRGNEKHAEISKLIVGQTKSTSTKVLQTSMKTEKNQKNTLENFDEDNSNHH